MEAEFEAFLLEGGYLDLVEMLEVGEHAYKSQHREVAIGKRNGEYYYKYDDLLMYEGFSVASGGPVARNVLTRLGLSAESGRSQSLIYPNAFVEDALMLVVRQGGHPDEKAKKRCRWKHNYWVKSRCFQVALGFYISSKKFASAGVPIATDVARPRWAKVSLLRNCRIRVHGHEGWFYCLEDCLRLCPEALEVGRHGHIGLHGNRMRTLRREIGKWVHLLPNSEGVDRVKLLEDSIENVVIESRKEFVERVVKEPPPDILPAPEPNVEAFGCVFETGDSAAVIKEVVGAIGMYLAAEGEGEQDEEVAAEGKEGEEGEERDESEEGGEDVDDAAIESAWEEVLRQSKDVIVVARKDEGFFEIVGTAGLNSSRFPLSGSEDQLWLLSERLVYACLGVSKPLVLMEIAKAIEKSGQEPEKVLQAYSDFDDMNDVQMANVLAGIKCSFGV